jgi:hypothetical protein
VKKYIIVILMLCLMIGIAHAEYSDVIQVQSIRAYVDGTDEVRLDWDDYISITTYPDTTTDIQLRLNNNHTSDISVNSDLIIELFNDDIEDTRTVSITKQLARTIVLSFYIPSGTNIGTYDGIIKYDYTINGTKYQEAKNIQIRVRQKHSTTEANMINLTNKIGNLTSQIELLTNTTNEEYKSCVEAKTECETEVGSYKLNMEEVKEKLENETIRIEQLNKELSETKTLLNTRKTEHEVETMVNAAREEEQKKNTQFGLILIAGGVIFYMWQKKKKEVGGEGAGKSLNASW